jgi:SAM-dependent methyltransferase
MVDWGAGSYERTASELEPVSETVIDRAVLSGDVDVIDLACGTGNAALLAAGRGARVVGIDGSSRLLDVARERARTQDLEIDFREGDLLEVPVADAAADLVVSIFGVIFARDPAQALREVRRVLRPGGRMLMTAWIPAGPIDAMLGAMGRILGRVNKAPGPQRFAWSDPDALGSLADEAGLTLQATMPALLAIRDRSPEAYVLAAREHPMAVAARPAIERAGVGDEVQAAMTAVLREANEDPGGFLVHSPYVVHDLLTI